MKIFVGNLPFSATEEDLHSGFSQYGNVLSARLITDRETGRSKGFAFVEMESQEQGEAAIQALNGADFEGRAIVVNEARPQEPRADRPFRGERRPGGGGGGGAGRPPRRNDFGGGNGNSGGGYGNRKNNFSK